MNSHIHEHSGFRIPRAISSAFNWNMGRRADPKTAGRHDQSMLQLQAALWAEREFSDDLLLRGNALREAEAWAEEHASALADVDRCFLEECGYAREDAIRAKGRQKLIGSLAILVSLVGLAALNLAFRARSEAAALALAQRDSAVSLEEALQAQGAWEETAVAEARARAEAESSRAAAIVESQQARDQLWQTRAANLTNMAQFVADEEPELAILLALEALDLSHRRDIHSSTTQRGAQVLEESMAGSPLQVSIGYPQATLPSTACLAFWDNGILTEPGPDGQVIAWDVPDGDEILRLPGFGGSLASIWWSPNRRQVLTVHTDGAARVWDSATARLVATLQSESGPIHAAAWSADASRIVTANGRRTAVVWDSSTGLPLQRLQAPYEMATWHVTWSHDDGEIVTTDAVGRSLVWDAHAGQRIGSFGEEEDDMNGREGDEPMRKVRVTLDADGVPTIHAATWETLREVACAVAGRNLTRAEWASYMHPGWSYQSTCPGFPRGE